MHCCVTFGLVLVLHYTVAKTYRQHDNPLAVGYFPLVGVVLLRLVSKHHELAAFKAT